MERFALQEKEFNLLNAQLKEKDALLESNKYDLAAIDLERQRVKDQCKILQDDDKKLQELKVCVCGHN